MKKIQFLKEANSLTACRVGSQVTEGQTTFQSSTLHIKLFVFFVSSGEVGSSVDFEIVSQIDLGINPKLCK